MYSLMIEITLGRQDSTGSNKSQLRLEFVDGLWKRASRRSLASPLWTRCAIGVRSPYIFFGADDARMRDNHVRVRCPIAKIRDGEDVGNV